MQSHMILCVGVRFLTCLDNPLVLSSLLGKQCQRKKGGKGGGEQEEFSIFCALSFLCWMWYFYFCAYPVSVNYNNHLISLIV